MGTEERVLHEYNADGYCVECGEHEDDPFDLDCLEILQAANLRLRKRIRDLELKQSRHDARIEQIDRAAKEAFDIKDGALDAKGKTITQLNQRCHELWRVGVERDSELHRAATKINDLTEDLRLARAARDDLSSIVHEKNNEIDRLQRQWEDGIRPTTFKPAGRFVFENVTVTIDKEKK